MDGNSEYGTPSSASGTGRALDEGVWGAPFLPLRSHHNSGRKPGLWLTYSRPFTLMVTLYSAISINLGHKRKCVSMWPPPSTPSRTCTHTRGVLRIRGHCTTCTGSHQQVINADRKPQSYSWSHSLMTKPALIYRKPAIHKYTAL